MQDADTYNQTHDALDPKKYGDNTPTKRSNTSGVWKEIKRLKEDGHGDKTHVCLVMLARGPDDPPNAPPRYCNCMLKLHKSKPNATGVQTWLTTRGVDHLRECHPVESAIGKKYADEKKKIEDTRW